MSKPPIPDKHECWPSNEDCVVYFPIGCSDLFETCLDAYLQSFPTVEPLSAPGYTDYFNRDVRDAVRHVPKYKRVVSGLYRLHQLRRTGEINIDVVEEDTP